VSLSPYTPSHESRRILHTALRTAGLLAPRCTLPWILSPSHEHQYTPSRAPLPASESWPILDANFGFRYSFDGVFLTIKSLEALHSRVVSSLEDFGSRGSIRTICGIATLLLGYAARFALITLRAVVHAIQLLHTLLAAPSIARQTTRGHFLPAPVEAFSTIRPNIGDCCRCPPIAPTPMYVTSFWIIESTLHGASWCVAKYANATFRRVETQ